ncbi:MULTISPECIES: hypothetical protein [unclassified Bradyrhizobium]|uniref:hypothetical protein n=1 Tax=unclassified Bradyrhizobium TaxID=2631580 RepID=UPI0029163CD3|nr:MULTISPECIES: hypothetical protein [unclassified Bradyrhizobium]
MWSVSVCGRIQALWLLIQADCRRALELDDGGVVHRIVFRRSRLKGLRPRPFNGLPDQGPSRLNARLHLRGKLVETRGSQPARGTLGARRQHRRRCQMKPRLKGDDLTDDAQIVAEQLQLSADGVQANLDGGLLDLAALAQELIQGRLDECRSSCA